MNSAATTTQYFANPGVSRIVFKVPNGKGGVSFLTYDRGTDRRIKEIVDGKIITKTEEGAVKLAAELKAIGAPARAFGYAVVFWT